MDGIEMECKRQIWLKDIMHLKFFKILTKIHKLFRHVQWLQSLYFVENDRFNII